MNSTAMAHMSRRPEGGGAIMVKNHLNPTEGPQIEAEMLLVSIAPTDKVVWTIGACYRPEVDQDQILDKICCAIDNIDTQNVILMGDFNFRNINWETGECTSAREQKFLDTLQDNLLVQMVDSPTRGSNLLDLVLVGDPSAVTKCEVGEAFGNSDHQIVTTEISCPVPRINFAPRKIYLYSKGDYQKLNSDFQEVDWEAKLSHPNIEENWLFIKETYNTLIEEHIPHKLVKPGRRHAPPWSRYKSVRKAKSDKRKSQVRANISQLEADKIIHQHDKRAVDDSIRIAKSDYEDQLVQKIPENPKLFWNYTRHFSRSSQTVETLTENGRNITNDEDKVEILNNFFASVLTVEPDSNLPFAKPPPKDIKYILEDIEVTPDMVRRKLIHLKANKANGPDNISTNVLRKCPDLDQPLTIIYNQSIQRGSMPQDWRDANITPLFKKGFRTLASNYRPISLTSQVVKILERILSDHIWDLLHKNDFVSCDQHGFRAGCSCVTQLLQCLHDWTGNFDKKISTDIVYLDFSKAFDSVPHKRLIYKLKLAGIRGKVLRWVECFLSNRRQRVILRNGCSHWEKVISGVPQGSILGPLLFLIYVNDIPETVVNVAKMFADDTKVYAEIIDRDACRSLQNDLTRLSAWSREWLLNFNATKCVVLRIREAINYMYTLDGIPLATEPLQKDLGVIISDTLKPSAHITSITKKANQRIGLIKRCFSGLNFDKVDRLFKGIIRPVLEYGSPVWNPWLTKDIDSLEKVQKRCYNLASDNESHAWLGLAPCSLEKRRKILDLCEVYKYVHGLYLNRSNSFFKFSNNNTRGHSLKISKQFSRTDIRKFFFSNRVVNSWNKLPEHVVHAPSISSFKKYLRSLPLGLKG